MRRAVAGCSSGFGPTNPTSTFASCTWSRIVSRICFVCGSVFAVTGAGSGPRGIGPKYFSTSGFTSAARKSPTIASVALFGE